MCVCVCLFCHCCHFYLVVHSFFSFFLSARFINHPVPGIFEANCYFAVDKKKVNVHAFKKILPGDELFAKYQQKDGKRNYFSGKGEDTSLTKEEVCRAYKEGLRNNKLSMNLRLSSRRSSPVVAKFVEIALQNMAVKREEKCRRERERYNS